MDKNGQLVMAQVTQSRNKAEIEEKKKELLETAEGKSLFFFARTHSREEKKVKFINIESVFNELDKDRSYHDIISRMLKIEFHDGCSDGRADDIRPDHVRGAPS